MQPLGNRRALGLMGGLQLGFIRGNQPRHRRLHAVIHGHGGRLVDGHEHRLAAIAPLREMQRHILGHLVQPVRVGDQRILAGKLAVELGLLRLVQHGLIQQRHPVLPAEPSLSSCSSGLRAS
jgi:hypothetical protein